MPKPLPPYLGAAYYPEAWPVGTLDEDIARAHELGINCLRVGEFAWSRMERRESEYDFDWLHHVVDRLGEADIAVVMCTPTATPPAWLTRKYPEVLAVSADGRPYGHGGRRHGCPASGKWRQLSAGIVYRMAAEFAQDPAIIGWQIDNEFGCHINESFSEAAVIRWREWLEELYGDLDTLNEAWGTELWSQYYTAWDEIPAPVQCGYQHHPSLRFRWKQFSSEMYAECCREQYAILHEAGCPNVTTDGMPNFHRLDYQDMFRDLDLIANNCYFPPDQYAGIIGECDWMRAAKPKPYWFTESATGWTGGGQVGSLYLPKPGSIRARGWLMTALGGEMVLYWLYRGHWSGQEMLHGSVLHPWGEPTPGSEEIASLAEDFGRAGAFLRATTVPRAKVAIHYHTPSSWILDHEPQVPGLQYDHCLNQSFHRPLAEANILRDVVWSDADLSGYRVLFTPFMAWLPTETLQRILQAVREGLTWVVGPFTSIRSEDATRFRHNALGPLEDALPIRVVQQFPATGIDPAAIWTDDCSRGKATLWCDVFEAQDDSAQPLAIYDTGPAAGKPAAMSIDLVGGAIKLLGFLPDPADPSWLRRIVAEAGVEPVCQASEGIAVVPRVGDGERGWIAFDWKGLGGYAMIPDAGTDLLSGSPVCGVVSLFPYDAAVIRAEA
jgi:beta-galactosidase GanA